MSDKTGIEWTDATWNPIVGCSVVSPGCTNCYAMKQAARIERIGGAPHYAGLTQPSKAGPVWTGKVALAREETLTQPLRWKRGRKIFVNSMGDLFHESVPDAWIDRVFAVMALSPQHTFQVLTKRSKRMREYGNDPRTPYRIARICVDLMLADKNMKVGDDWPVESEGDIDMPDDIKLRSWPLPNVWLGVSAEDQARADERIPELLATPAAVRFVSAEPLLGPTRFDDITIPQEVGTWQIDALYPDDSGEPDPEFNGAVLDWVIVGGESGPGARPMHPDWARSIRDQCAAADVPFFFKQWGEWLPGEANDGQFDATDMNTYRRCDNHFYDWPAMHRLGRDVVHNFGTHRDPWSGKLRATRVGKHRAGRLLDGVEHSAFPETT